MIITDLFCHCLSSSGIYRGTRRDDKAGRTSHDNHCVDLADRQSDFYGHIQPFAANAR